MFVSTCVWNRTRSRSDNINSVDTYLHRPSFYVITGIAVVVSLATSACREAIIFPDAAALDDDTGISQGDLNAIEKEETASIDAGDESDTGEQDIVQIDDEGDQDSLDAGDASEVEDDPAGTGGAKPAGKGGAKPAGTGGAKPAGTGGADPAGTGGADPAGTGGADPAGTGGSDPAGTGGSDPAGTGGGESPEFEGCTPDEGTTAHFSFFVTSLEGLQRLSGNPDGFGGDLRFGEEDGLSGADEICRQLAEYSFAGAGCKTWRAFLSITKDAKGKPVHAKDRIGDGPWYDRLGRVVAMSKPDLLQTWPAGADTAIARDLPNEYGFPNHNPDNNGYVDNHITLTGTGPNGLLYSDNWAFTCHDWTSKEPQDGTPHVGFSWWGGAAMMPTNGWYTGNFNETGCAPLVNLTNVNYAGTGVGSSGGYGGFYCLALEP